MGKTGEGKRMMQRKIKGERDRAVKEKDSKSELNNMPKLTQRKKSREREEQTDE